MAVLLLVVSVSASAIAIEHHTSYVENSWIEADSLANAGIDSSRIYGWPSWLGWNRNDDIIGDVWNAVINGEGTSAFGVFGKFRDNACYIITMKQEEESSNNLSLIGTANYNTFLSENRLYILFHSTSACAIFAK